MAIYSNEEDPNIKMWEEQEKKLAEERLKRFEQETKRLPRIGDKVLIDLNWKQGSLEEPNPTTKGRILGVNETHFCVQPIGKPEIFVLHNCVKLDI